MKIENFMKTWNSIIFTKMTLLPKCALWAIWAPQTTKKHCAMELFPPLAGKVRFFAKSRTFRSFSHFSQKSTFSWFSWFLWKTWFSESSNGYRVQKVQKVDIPWFSRIFHKITKFLNFLKIFGNFENISENPGWWKALFS